MSFILSLLYILVLAVLGLLAAAAIYTRYLGRDIGKLVPRAGKLHPVTGGTLHYVESGPQSGQPLVLIHGLSGQLQHFTYALSGQLEGDYRVIAVDRPGCGYSDRDGDDQAALSQQARMIWELLDHLGVSKPVLVGHSLGGAVSLAMALERPGAVGALALLCPLTHEQTEAPEAFDGLEVTSGFLRRLIGHTIAVPMAKKNAGLILTEVFRPDACPQDFMIRAGAALGLRPKAFITASADMVAAGEGIPGQSARYESELKTPGGVLFGAGDNILPPAAHGDAMARYGLTVEELDGHGHMIPITAPDACADFIRRMAAKAT